jgi:hypothetical protein
MSDRRILGVLALAAALSAGLTACRTNAVETPAARASGAAAPAEAPAAVPHGDHNPHHGGVVLMKGEMHYEVVLDPGGRSHQVFFSDAMREELPASVASSVTLTIRRPGAADELIPLQIDNTGESWIGAGGPVADEAKTTVRIAFTISDAPYFIDVPFVSRR